MSNRKKPAPELLPNPQGMTVISSIYDQYEYTLANGMLGIRFGRRGHTHADITIAQSPILDLAEKLKATMGAPPNE